MKLIEIVQARAIIGKYRNERISTPLAYKLMKILKTTENEEVFYREKLREIVDRYCQKDKSGEFVCDNGGLSVREGETKACENALRDLSATALWLQTKSAERQAQPFVWTKSMQVCDTSLGNL